MNRHLLTRAAWRLATVLLMCNLATGCNAVDTVEDIEPNDTEPGVFVNFPMNYECEQPVVFVGETGGEDQADHFAIVLKPSSSSTGGTDYNKCFRRLTIDWLTDGVSACLIRPAYDGQAEACVEPGEAPKENIFEGDPNETVIVRVASVDGTELRYQVALKCDDNDYNCTGY